jgi:soluble lytic murein transglycosylase
MARIPGVDSFSQTPGLAPRGGFTSSYNAVTAKENLRGQQELGRGVEAYGTQLREQETAQLEKFNQLRVQDALNQLASEEARLAYDPTEGFNNRKGKQAFVNDAGVSLEEEYTGKYRETVSKIGSGLGNPAQRQAFEMAAQQRGASFQSGLIKHYSTEARNYEESVYDGTIKTLTEQMPRFASNPEALRGLVGSTDQPGTILGAATAKARLRGLSDIEAAADANSLAAKAVHNTISASIELGEYDSAEKMYNTYGDMLGGDGVRLIRPMKILKDTRQAQAALHEGRKDVAWRSDTSDIGRLHRLQLFAESSNTQAINGKLQKTTVRGKDYVGIGAMGEEAAIDAAKALGIPLNLELMRAPTEEGENYNGMLSRKYLELKLAEFGGDIPAALGAYNWGSKGVKEAMVLAKITGKSWIDYAPQETKDYVAKIMKGFNRGEDDTTARATSATYVEAALAKLPEDASPEARANVQELARKQYEEEEKQRKEVQNLSAEQAIDFMRQGKSWAELPVSIQANIPPSEQEKIRKAGTNSTTTSEGFMQYTELMQNPTQLRAMSRSEVYALGASMDQDKLGKLLEIHGGKNPEIPAGGINSAVKRVFAEAGVDVTETDGKAREAEMTSYMYDLVQIEQERLGKQLNDAEIDSLARNTMRKSIEVDGFFGKSEKPMMDVRVNNISSTTRKSIEKILKMRYPDLPVDDSTILRVYLESQRTAGAKANGAK